MSVAPRLKEIEKAYSLTIEILGAATVAPELAMTLESAIVLAFNSRAEVVELMTASRRVDSKTPTAKAYRKGKEK